MKVADVLSAQPPKTWHTGTFNRPWLFQQNEGLTYAMDSLVSVP